MKKILVLLAVALFVLPAVAQNVLPWEEENYSVVAFQQGQKGTLMVEVQNHAIDVPTCQSNAKVQALYKVLFIGVDKGTNIPASPPICLDGKKTYNEKIDFFKDYIKPNNDFISDVKPNPKKPISKVSKKEFIGNFIVTINIDGLRNDLEAQGIIKKMAEFKVKPSVLVVPSDKWMVDHGLVYEKDQQGQKVWDKDYQKAVVHDDIASALKAVAFTYGGPDGAFEVKDLQGMLEAIRNEESRAAMSSDFTQESSEDIMARVIGADIWIKVNFDRKPVENGTKMQFSIQLEAYDPNTRSNAFSGDEISKTTVGDDVKALTTAAMTGAAESFRPQLFSYFTKRQEEGMAGTVTIKLGENMDINFQSMMEFKDKEKEFSWLIKKDLKNYCMPESVIEDGPQSKTLLKYKVKIPVEYYDEDEEETVVNSLSLVASNLRSKLRKMEYDAIYNPIGLGEVEIKIIPKE